MPRHGRIDATQRRRPQWRAQELLAAALALFVERGYGATTCEAVAARAGVSKGTVYLYFSSKEALFKAVVQHHLQAPMAEGEHLLRQSQGSSADLLRRLLTLWRERVVTHAAGGICKVIMAEARNFPLLAAFYLDEVMRPGQKLIAGAIQRGVASGEFRPVVVEHVVQVILATPVFLATYRHSLGACGGLAPSIDEMTVLDAQIDLLVHGLYRQRDDEQRDLNSR